MSHKTKQTAWRLLIHDNHLEEVNEILYKLFKQDKIRYLNEDTP